MPGVLVLDSKKKSIILENCHYLEVTPGHLTGFPVGNLEGFLVGQNGKRVRNHRYHRNDQQSEQNITGHIIFK